MSTEHNTVPQSSDENSIEREDSTTAATAVSPVESRGEGFRFIASFAAVGLLLAGVVGVWTLQSSNDDAEARQRAIAEQSALSGSESTSASESGNSTATSDEATTSAPSDNPQSPRSERPAQTSTKSVTPLGNDPYLPPNSWDGDNRNDGSDFFVVPSETVYAEPTPEATQLLPLPDSSNGNGAPSASQSARPSFPGTSLPPFELPTFSGGTVTPTETMTELPTEPGGEPDEPSAPDTGDGSTPTDTTGANQGGRDDRRFNLFERESWERMTDTR